MVTPTGGSGGGRAGTMWNPINNAGKGSTSGAALLTSLAVEKRRDHPAAAVVLAAVAGCADAIGFLSLNGLFLSFMTGNITRAGVAAQEQAWHVAGLAIGIILLFVGGVSAGTLIGLRLGRNRAGVMLLLAAALVAASAWLAARTDHIGVPMLVMGLGMLNTVFPGIGVTYFTGTLVRIGEAIGGDPERRGGVGPELSACAAFGAGVLAGAAWWPAQGATLLWVLAGILALMAIAHFVPRSARVS